MAGSDKFTNPESRLGGSLSTWEEGRQIKMYPSFAGLEVNILSGPPFCPELTVTELLLYK